MIRIALLLIATATLGGCSTRQLVDDGRPLTAQLMRETRATTQAMRAVVKLTPHTARLVKTTECEPMFVAPVFFWTADLASGDYAIAMLRGHGLDEKLRVVYAPAGLELPDLAVVTEVAGTRDRARDLFIRNAELARAGKAYLVKLESGRELRIEPVQVCRNVPVFSPPGQATLEALSWQHSVLPAQIFMTEELSEDEILWMVLWSQGLSVEGWGRMRAYAAASGLFQLALKAVPVGGGSMATVMSNAQVKLAAGEAFKSVLTSVALQGAAAGAIREGVNQAMGHVAPHLTRWGANAVAATAFEAADRWALRGITELGRNPQAGLMLHRRLLAAGFLQNPFALDAERLSALVADWIRAVRSRSTPDRSRLLTLHCGSCSWELTHRNIGKSPWTVGQLDRVTPNPNFDPRET